MLQRRVTLLVSVILATIFLLGCGKEEIATATSVPAQQPTATAPSVAVPTATTAAAPTTVGATAIPTTAATAVATATAVAPAQAPLPEGIKCCPLFTIDEASKTWPKMVFDVKPTSFKEAPVLAERVKAGTLPPLSQRLPEDYAVIHPGTPQGIGKYGGTWKSVFTGPADEQNVERIIHNHLLFWTADLQTITPHIFKGWEANSASTVFTFHMRKGMKWSDGKPFTADDVIFWYEDILLNDELLPAKFGWAKAGGKLGVWKKVNDLTFTVTFEVPYGLFPDQVASLQVGSNISQLTACGGMMSPRHYMQQFHAKYVGLEQANKVAKDAGFDNWAKMFCTKNNPIQNPETPSTAAWVPRTGFNTQQSVWERNPYYWAVDSSGNQLPYIDRIVFDLVQDLEVLNLKAIAGEFTAQNRHMDVNKLPVFIDNQAKGKYRVELNKSPVAGGSSTGIGFNQDFAADPEIASLLQNANFRRALSMGIDRDEINEVFFLGQSRPASTCAWPDPPYAPGEELDQKYHTLDAGAANRLLDSVGLTRKDSDGFRLLPSGKRLDLQILTPGGTFQDWPGQMEMISQHWKTNLGIRATVDVVDRSLREKRLRANEAMLAVWGVNGSSGLWLFPENSLAYDWYSMMGPVSGQWFQDNKSGREPTGLVREMQKLFEKATQSQPADRIELGKEIHRIRCEEVFYIGTVTGGGLGAMWILNEDLAPIPQGIIGSVHAQNPGSVWTETWYFKSGQAGVPAN